MKRFLIVPALVAAVLVWALLDERAGIRAWLRMRADLQRASERIDGLRHENASLHQQVEALRDDPVAIEGAIREDLELARPGEVIVKLPRVAPPEGDARPRFP